MANKPNLTIDQLPSMSKVDLNATLDQVAVYSESANTSKKMSAADFLSSIPAIDPTNPANITQDSTHRFVTDTQVSTWNAAVPNTRTVNGHPLSSDVTVTKSDVGLGNVDNTTDLNKAISTATQSALDAKEPLLPSKVGNPLKFLQVNGTATGWQLAPAGGTGDMVGPASAVDSNFVAFNTATGKLTKDSGYNGGSFTPIAHATNLSNPHSTTKTQVGLGNVPNLDTSNPANIVQDTTHRFITDTERTSWNGKQDALGFTAVPDTRTVAGHALSADVVVTKSDVGLGAVTNDAQIAKSLGISKGDLIVFNASATPQRLPIGSDGMALIADSSQTPGVVWGAAPAATAAWSVITGKPEITVGDTGFLTLDTALDALAAVGNPEKVLVLPPGNHTTTGKTVPANLTLYFVRGALLTSGTLAINGELQAGNYKILNGGILVIGSTCRNIYVNPLWWGAKGDGDGAGAGTDDTTALNAMNTSLGSNVIPVIPPPGIYNVLSGDVSFNMGVVNRGVQFYLGSLSCTGTLTSTYTSKAGTITLNTTTRYVVGSGTSFVIGADDNKWIKTAGGRFYRIHKVIDSTHLYLFDVPTANESGVAWSLSNWTVAGSGTTFSTGNATNALSMGDFLYCGGKTFIATNITSDTSIRVAYYMNSEISSGTAFTRGVRCSFSYLQAGRYQVFCGPGLGKVSGSVTGVAYPEWYGLVYDATKSTQNSDAIEKCVFAMNRKIEFGLAEYYIARPVPVIGSVKYIGSGIGDQYSGRGSSLCAYTNFVGMATMESAPGSPTNTATPGVYFMEITGLRLDCMARTYGKIRVSGIYINNSYGNCCGPVHHNRIDNCWDAIKFVNSASRAMVHHNQTGGSVNVNGVICTFDMFVQNNELSCGKNVMLDWATPTTNYGQFNSASNWTANDWTITTGSPGNAAKAAGTTNPLFFTFPAPGIEPHKPVVVRYTVSRSAGNLTVSIAGVTLNSGYTAKTGTFYYITGNLADPDSSFNIRFTPDASFAGTVTDVRVYTGIAIDSSGGGNLLNDNIMFGDYNAAIGVRCGNDLVNGNRIMPFACGVYVIGNAQIINNWIGDEGQETYADCVHLYSSGATVRDNRITGAARFGLSVAPTNTDWGWCSDIGNNKFYSNGVDDMNNGAYDLYASFPATPITVPMISDNVGVDRGSVITLLSLTYPGTNSTAPDVQGGRNFITANTSPTLIHDFANGFTGKEIFVRFNDTNTTLDFTNTSGLSKLKSPLASNPTAAVSDTLRAVKGDDGNWYCQYFDNTP